MMKKIITLLTVAAFLLIATPAMAEDAYISIGGVHAIENFDSGVGFDNTEGLNLRAGYNITDSFALELTYDNLPGFSWTYDAISADVDIETFTLAGKLSTGEEIKPYLTAGLGAMRGDLVVSYLDQSLSASESDLCAKAGGGIDFFIEDNVSIGIEGAHVWGLNDLDVVEYTMLTCGISLHF